MLAAAMMLAACDTMAGGERIEAGTWRQVGTHQPPLELVVEGLLLGHSSTHSGVQPTYFGADRPRPGYPLEGATDFRVDSLRKAGADARRVAAGDLVHLKVRPASPAAAPAREAWVWTGREPGAASLDEIESWGSLGTANVRFALIGRGVGEVIRFQATEPARFAAVIPRTVFTHIQQSLLDNNWRKQAHDWGAEVLGSRADVEIEILGACPARLFRRKDAMFYARSKSAPLHWSALESECPGPRGARRIEAGPMITYREVRKHQSATVDLRGVYHKLEIEAGRGAPSR